MFWKKWFSKVSTSGVCSLCDEVFLDKNLLESSEKFFCKPHYKTFTDSHWMEAHLVTSSSSDPEKALIIQELKDELKKENILTFIETTYDEKDGEIYSHFQMYCRSQDYNTIMNKFKI